MKEGKVIWFTDTFGIMGVGDIFKRVRIKGGLTEICEADTFTALHFTCKGRVVMLLDMNNGVWYAHDTEKDERLGTGIGFIVVGDVVGLIPNVLCTTDKILTGYDCVSYLIKRYGADNEVLHYLSILCPNITFYRHNNN